MKKQKTSLREKITKGLVGITCAGIFLGSSLMGCATSGRQGGLFGNYGRLSSNKEITKEFTNYELKADHNYFIAGARKDSPNAILALDNRYTLDNTRFWHPLNSQDKTLQDLVEKMKDASDNIPYGANVMDHNGNDIGDWYSTTSTTIVKTKDGKAFLIYAPTAGGCGVGGSGSSGGASGGGGSSGK